MMGIVAAVTVIVIVLTGIVPVNTLIPAFESVSHSSLSLSNFLSNLCRSNLVVLTGSVVLTSLALTSFVPASLVLGRLESLSLPSLEPLSCPESTSPGVLAHGLFLPLLLRSSSKHRRSSDSALRLGPSFAKWQIQIT